MKYALDTPAFGQEPHQNRAQISGLSCPFAATAPRVRLDVPPRVRRGVVRHWWRWGCYPN